MKRVDVVKGIKDYLIYGPVYALISLCAAWLFYDTFIAALPAILFLPLFIGAVRKIREKKIKEELTTEFLRALVSVSTSLSAGMSAENAFICAAGDMEKLYGKRSLIFRELTLINSRVSMGERMSDALHDFAVRTKIPEIYDFAVVFSVAKEKGAGFSEVISSCASIMGSKRQAENEARVMIRAKQYEQRVMCIIPPGIIAYLKISSGGFMKVLYHNTAGILIMSAGLAVYVAAIVISEKIGDVSV